jgi:hypothetical protein
MQFKVGEAMQFEVGKVQESCKVVRSPAFRRKLRFETG